VVENVVNVVLSILILGGPGLVLVKLADDLRAQRLASFALVASLLVPISIVLFFGVLLFPGGQDFRSTPLMTPPTWLDAQGRRRPTLACWTCGREIAPMRYRAEDLRHFLLLARCVLLLSLFGLFAGCSVGNSFFYGTEQFYPPHI